MKVVFTMQDAAHFLPWHYSQGISFYVTSWLKLFEYIVQYFSLPLLLKTLFAPWKRLIDEDTGTGFDIQRYLQTLTFNIVSRVIGAFVRITLFFAGVLLLVVCAITGLFGLIAWLIFPFFGALIYIRWVNNPTHYITSLLGEMKRSGSPFRVFWASEAGLHIARHIGIDEKLFVENAAEEKILLGDFAPESTEALMKHFVDSDVWSHQFFRKNEMISDDLVFAARLWDQKKIRESYVGGPELGAPGIGLELMFGYTPTLNKYSTDLSATKEYSHHLIGREEVVKRMERVLIAGSSVVLTGDPGIGKKTVVLEFAHRARSGEMGAKMAYRRVLELDHNSLISGTSDLNRKKKRLANVLKEAANAGNIILMVRDIHRITNLAFEGADFTDVFEDALSKRELKLIVVTTPKEYEKYIAPNMRLRKYLETIEIPQPSLEEAMEILLVSATRWESMKDITITLPAIRKILDESDRYITDTPFPEKALELLDAVVLYREQKADGKVVTIEDVNTVLSERTGVSFTRLTGEEKQKLGNLEEIIHERLINQNTAVNLIAKSIRARSVAVTKKEKPLGSYLFLGPTGVGKTQTAKVLSEVYFGSEDSIVRFDMAEYAGREGYERLMGSVGSGAPGELATAIKNNPASLLLLDEFEKATKDVHNLFLRLLDEGVMSDAFGNKLLGKNLFIIGTSNAGAEYIRTLVQKGIEGEDLQKSVLNYVQEKGLFSPEFLNRFDGIVVFEPLKQSHLAKIAALILHEFAEDLKEKNIYLEVTDELTEILARDGYDPAFGARPMERIVTLEFGDLVGKMLISGRLKEGTRFTITSSAPKEYALKSL